MKEKELVDYSSVAKSNVNNVLDKSCNGNNELWY